MISAGEDILVAHPVECCACRRRKGPDGAWLPLVPDRREPEHSLQISHGICPECIRMLYPKRYHPQAMQLEER